MKYLCNSLVLFLCLFSVFAKAQVVAVVGHKTITLKDFNQRYDQMRKYAPNAPPPPRAFFLEDLVRYEVGLQEADKKKLKEDPIVRDRMNQELYKALVENELSTKIDAIRINENEMKAYYEKNPEIRVSHILIEVKADATKEQKATAQKRAEEVFSDVKKSKDPFEKLVNLYTDDIATKKNGGDIGWHTRLTLGPEIYDNAIKMSVGQVKGLIESPYGFHIVKLLGKHSYEESNKSQTRAAILDQKRNRIFNDYFEDLKKKYKVKTYPSLVKGL